MTVLISIAGMALAIGAVASAQADAPAADVQTVSYWTDSRRGWHFYEEPPTESIAPLPVPATPKAAPPPPAEIVAFKRLQKTLEEYRQIAIIHPTEANVRRYMALEAKIVGQASVFADVAQRVAWASPSLDPTLQGRPVNAKALDVFEQDQLQQRSRAVAALGRDHVLFFFFRSDCPYCHAFAPTLRAFEARHGLQVVPISLDGGALPDFAQPRHDNGIARTLHVTQVPAVFLAQPFAGRITPIGFGMLSEAQLLERITVVSTTAPDAVPLTASPPLSLR